MPFLPRAVTAFFRGLEIRLKARLLTTGFEVSRLPGRRSRCDRDAPATGPAPRARRSPTDRDPDLDRGHSTAVTRRTPGTILRSRHARPPLLGRRAVSGHTRLRRRRFALPMCRSVCHGPNKDACGSDDLERLGSSSNHPPPALQSQNGRRRYPRLLGAPNGAHLRAQPGRPAAAAVAARANAGHAGTRRPPRWRDSQCRRRRRFRHVTIRRRRRQGHALRMAGRVRRRLASEAAAARSVVAAAVRRRASRPLPPPPPPIWRPHLFACAALVDAVGLEEGERSSAAVAR